MAARTTSQVTIQKYFRDIVSLYQRRSDVKAYLEIILSLSAIGIFVFLAIKPTLTTIGQLLTEIGDKKTLVAQMDEKIQNLTTAQSLLQTQKESIDLLQKSVPNAPNVNSFVRQVEGVARRQNLSILGITVEETLLSGKEETPSPPKGTEPLPSEAKALTLTTIISGNYPSLNNFIQDVESLLRPFKEDGVTLSTTQVGESQTINLSISGRAAFQ